MMSEPPLLVTELDIDEDAITPEMRRRMAVLACGWALDQDDPKAAAGELLDMLGLRGDQPSGCRVCGGPLCQSAAKEKGKYLGTCSAVCRRQYLGGAE